MSLRKWVLSALAAGAVGVCCSPSSAQVAAAARSDSATSELLVFITPGQSAADLARDFGLASLGHLADTPNIVRFQAASVDAAFAARAGLAGDGRVQQAFVQYDDPRVATAFTPNDPFFFPGSNPPVGGPGSTGNTLYPGQWYLVNKMPGSSSNDASIDVRVQGAWNRNLTGSGVVIGIVDSAVQVGHPDLSPNNRTALSYDFVSDDADPTPTGTESAPNHGTAVAGVAAARGGNGVGVTGAAPFAGLAGFRTNLQTAALQNAITHRNDAIKVKNHSYSYENPFPSVAATEAVLATAAGQGVINVFAAGNARGTAAEDANKIGLQNSPHVITVAALGSDGTYAYYSSFGANVFVTAPSSASANNLNTVTTDRTGSAGYNTTGSGNFAAASGGGTGLDYTNDFGGSSAAAPLVSGVIALAVEARNNAGLPTDIRVIKHLLARTSRVVDASNGGWQTNAAGFRTNQNYGFGLIDADALTLAATQFSGATALTTHAVSTTSVGLAIPDNNATGVSRTFVVSAANAQPLEEVLITLDIAHPSRGHLEAYLTSPSGHRRRLFKAFPADTADNISYEFLSNAYWGENPNGTWTLTLSDLAAGDVGTWTSFSATLRMGTLVPVPEPATVGLVGALGLAGWVVRRRRRAAAV